MKPASSEARMMAFGVVFIVLGSVTWLVAGGGIPGVLALGGMLVFLAGAVIRWRRRHD